MSQHLAALALLVRDYDEAIAYFVNVLGFSLVEDTPLGAGKRWVRVAPPVRAGDAADASGRCSLLLARAINDEQRAAIGRQGGGRVFLFLYTDDFWRDHRAFAARGVKFCEAPREESYGTVVVFEDLYGNRWDLVQRRVGKIGAESPSHSAEARTRRAAEAGLPQGSATLVFDPTSKDEPDSDHEPAHPTAWTR